MEAAMTPVVWAETAAGERIANLLIPRGGRS
jgi:hypothetical protein